MAEPFSTLLDDIMEEVILAPGSAVPTDQLARQWCDLSLALNPALPTIAPAAEPCHVHLERVAEACAENFLSLDLLVEAQLAQTHDQPFAEFLMPRRRIITDAAESMVGA